jgi:ABC-type uncharacterized transport system permease subunit
MILSTASPLLRGGAPLALALVAVLAYAAAMLPPRSAGRLPGLALVAGWLVHLVLLVLDIGGAGQPGAGARLGFAPVLSLTVWLVIAVHAVESRFVPLPAVRRWLAPLGALAVVLALVFPGETRPIESAWAPLHYALGIGSYGLFGAAVLHALMLDAAERRLRLRGGRPGHALGMPLLQLERLTFRFVEAGFTVLTATLLFGVASSDRWHWDPKRVYSLLGWAVFAALLAGRHWRGWRGRRATRWLYAGTLLLLLAYVGTRFVLEVLLQRAP